jgi:hypothetical protein
MFGFFFFFLFWYMFGIFRITCDWGFNKWIHVCAKYDTVRGMGGVNLAVECPSLSHLVKFDYSSLRECSSMREGNMSLLNDGKTIKICWIFLIYHTWWNINLPVTCLFDFPIMYVIYSYADFGTLK